MSGASITGIVYMSVSLQEGDCCLHWIAGQVQRSQWPAQGHTAREWIPLQISLIPKSFALPLYYANYFIYPFSSCV